MARRHFTVAILSWIAMACAEAAPVADDSAAIAWLRAQAVPFADTTPTTEELQPLIARLGAARIVGIGEATHGDHQDQSFKAALIKALVTSGRIDMVALECSRQAGAYFDAYARGGPGDLVALIRSKHFFRTWQDDEMAGLILWLRARNATATTPVRIIGIDNQDANRDIAVALTFVEKQDKGLAQTLSSGVSPMLDGKAKTLGFYPWVVATPQPQYDQATKGVAAVIAAFTAHRDTWSKSEGFEDAFYAARLAAQGLKEFDLEAGKPDLDVSTLPADYGNRRDIFMAANLIERSGGGHRIALWAHDLHVIADADPVQKAAGWLTMGSELRRQIGQDYRAIGFAWSEGQFLSRTIAANTGSALAQAEWESQNLPNARPQDLGGTLAATGLPRFWIDLRKIPKSAMGWATTPKFRGWAGAVTNRAQWQSTDDNKAALVPGFDILVYFHTITPSQLWPKLAK